MRNRTTALTAAAALAASAIMAPAQSAAAIEEEEELQLPFFFEIDDENPIVDPEVWVDTMLLHNSGAAHSGMYADLTEEDYAAVAEELGIEVAVIKAVVDIEAGKRHEGFWQPGKPLINFDLTMYRKFAPKHNVSLSKAQKRSPVIFARPDVKKYGSYQGGQYARYEAALEIDRESAMESVFWGMFQIGGFNWRKCGTDSIEEFVEIMSRSERDQLELFARFIQHNGMVEDLRAKRWLAFALKYNGPKARKRGYHTRLAAAYKKYSN